jgi:hypothetical protein
VGWTSIALKAAPVETVRVAVAAAAPGMLTGVVVPKLKVGRFWAPTGLEVMAADRLTLPVNPLVGVIVIVLVPPLPGLTFRVSGEPERMKLCGGVTRK